MSEFLSALVQLPLVRDGSQTTIRSPADVRELCSDIVDLAQETFHVIMVNAKNRVLDRTMTGLGVADACLVHPREVFRRAIATNAVAVILAHNHPSGDPTPSAEDLRITRQLVEAGRIIDIKVLDHVVVTRGARRKLVSMREDNLVVF